jgi:hypothetical protein
MSCQTRPGPQVFVRAIESAIGHTISQQQWHVMKEMAFSDAAYERSQELKYETNIAARQAAARAYAQEVTGRSRVTPQEAVDAAERLRAHLEKDEGRVSPKVGLAAEKMVGEAKETKMTAGTVAIANLMARKGVRVALRDADRKIAEKKRNVAAKKRVLKAADDAKANGEAKMAEGLRKAAEMMSEDGDYHVLTWSNSGDMSSKYPGLRERYDEITRGPVEAREFAMFSYEGNMAALAASEGVSQQMRDAANSDYKWTREQVAASVDTACEELYGEFYEIYDTEPRLAFWNRVGDTARELGWLEPHEGYWD